MSENKRFDEKEVEGFNLEFDFDQQKFNRFLLRAGIELDVVKEQALYELGCGKPKGAELIPNNACVLFFAIKPENHIEQNYITCVRYQGNSMASVIDRKDFYGDLIDLIDDAEAFVKKHTRLAYRFEGFKRIDVEEYPYSAIREAIINAICHRSYEEKNNIFVNVFDDRIEVISPGSIPGNLTLKEVYGISHPRNYRIVELFRKAGLIEKLGSGLKRMEELMLFHGLKKPEYEANQAHFKVTFHGPKEKLLKMVKPVGELNLKDLGLNDRQIKILKILHESGSLTRKEYEDKLSTSKVTAFRDLRELEQKGMIKTEGKGKQTRYYLNQ